MFICHVTFDQPTQWQHLLRSKRKRWTEVSCIRFLSLWSSINWPWQRLLRGEQKSWTEVSCIRFLSLWSSISWPWQRLLRGKQKSWTEVSCIRFFCPVIFDQLTVATFASRWAKELNTSVLYKVPLPCDLRSADPMATVASRWAKELNRSVLYKVPLPVIFDQLTVATFASRWAKEVNRSVLYKVPLPCDLRSADRGNACFQVSKRGEQKFPV